MAFDRSEMLREMWKKRRPSTIEEYIYSKCVVNHQNGCWEAKTVKPPKYCYCEYNHEKFVLHRKAYEVFIGPIPDGLIVRHKCDNSICCNPEHLEVGTKKDNRQDFMKRHPRSKELMQEVVKRGTEGVKNFWANLSPEEKERFCKDRAAKQKAIKDAKMSNL